MAAHFLDCFAPGVGPEAGDRIAGALSRVGRKVQSRQRLTPGGPAPAASPGTLRWRVHQLRDDGGSFLVAEETGPARWDLAFLRALSASVDGIVVAREHYRREERRGLATFLSGRTVEVAARDMQAGATTLGGTSLDALTGGGRSVDDVYESRFAELCNTLAFRLRESTVLAAEDWQVSPPVERFAAEKPSPQSWAFLPNLEAAAWKQALASGVAKGWEWRAATVRGTPFIELRRAGAYEEADVAGLTAKVPVVVTALELRGGGEPFRWAEVEKGQVAARGTASGAQELFKVLYRAATLVGEGPGMVLGRGTEGWTPVR